MPGVTRGTDGGPDGARPRLADRWAPLTAQDTYRDGLEALVDGLLAAR